MGSQTEENYLKALYKLANQDRKASISELSAALGVSVPTANSMVKKMDLRGFLTYEKYRPITVTTKGMTTAALIIRKHRLTEMYLVSKMGFSWENVHEIAEQVEHVTSEAFFDRMDELLGYPKFDPHGSPIPDKDGNTEKQDLTKLSSCKIGQTVTLNALAQSEISLLNFLNSKSLTLGTKLIIVSMEAFDGSVAISYEKHKKEVLSKKVCDNLLVSVS